MVSGLGDMGLCQALAAVGSAIGAGIAGMAAIGAWKRVFMQNKAAPFVLVAFAAAPLTQTIYGMILRNAIQNANWAPESYIYQMILGAFAGAAIGISAIAQGQCAAKACDAFGETGKGFGNNMMILGLTETVAIFVLVFTMMALPKM